MDKLKKTKSGHKIIADDSWNPEYQGKTVAKVTDTGNGYIFKFPSYNCVCQTEYICMNYSEAAFILRLLKEYEDALC